MDSYRAKGAHFDVGKFFERESLKKRALEVECRDNGWYYPRRIRVPPKAILDGGGDLERRLARFWMGQQWQELGLALEYPNHYFKVIKAQFLA